ncbi:MAG: hypothetical protein AVDCRST_MAG61-1823 [uncultured Friedmanniella sp.]|uniref:Uncharacterized protein n=1 Tax=uncultured Friedmanniella sp. TaxID=335381 RepID=A0A6J4KRH2_9ACTN|nr:FAD-dependent oxidoreductase [uncultured Friedmanniella sp.]CAA9312971.1 MAG: hypothetical protein AVDCRST_MAG61-1823 [uncultured Friedmanniella sp.]
MRRVLVLGGGVAGLTAAWHLSEPSHHEDLEVTVVQRGWRLGGKGASSRGVHGRIEEHGLHVWLGYYDNAFALVRQVYQELDRPATDPSCPIRTWRDAFSPSNHVGVEEQVEGSWQHWSARFTPNSAEPGTPDGAAGASASPAVFLQRAARLLADFSASLEQQRQESRRPEVVLSASPSRPAHRAPGGRSDLGRLVRQAEVVALVAALEALRLAGTMPERWGLRSQILDGLSRLSRQWDSAARRSTELRRTADLANLVIACLRGTVRDNLLIDPAGFGAVDHLDFREWLRRHGAAETTLRSPLIRGMYDLVFAYERGDRSRPRFSAGLGLLLASKMFFDYKGSIFWHMEAGMGDVVFAPLYQALSRRGVRFRFFHRLDQLHLSPDRRSIAAITLGRQAELKAARDDYDPLVTVKGLPCFPSAPRVEQLRDPVADDLETHWSDRTAEAPVRLLRGRHFDDAILATSLGMVPHVAGELLKHSPRWRSMVSGVSTVPTQSFQAWLRTSEHALGWSEGLTVSGYDAPFDTYASMSHLLGREDWPAEAAVKGTAYFCSVLPSEAAADPVAAGELVRDHAIDHLTERIGHFWPAAVAADGTFAWDVLHSPGKRDESAAMDAQYWRANVDPSDQYVQSLPGSSAYRLQADESGYDNLFLAGDWINCGLNAGCIEAAVMAGAQAANAVLGRPLTAGVLGDWYGVRS